MTIQPCEELPFGRFNTAHNLAFPAVAQVTSSVDNLQLPNVPGEFQGEILPAATLHQTLPCADVVVPGTIVFDMVHHPIWIQSRRIDHAVKSLSDFSVT